MACLQKVFRLHHQAMEISANFLHLHLNVSIYDQSDSLLGRRHFRQHHRSEGRRGRNQSLRTQWINLYPLVRNYRTRYHHILSIHFDSVPPGKPLHRHENGRLCLVYQERYLLFLTVQIRRIRQQARQ